MKIIAACLLALSCLPFALPAHAAPIAVQEGVPAPMRGSVKGYDVARHTFHAAAGEVVEIVLQSGKAPLYFNLTPAGGREAVFNGSIEGERAVLLAPQAGDYQIDVYFMRSAARRGAQGHYTLQLTRHAAQPEAYFRQVFRAGNISFLASATRTAQGSRLRIQPFGLQIDNTAIERELPGEVQAAEVADLNADGSPELYVYLRAAEKRGSVFAVAANRRKSLSEVFIDSLENTAGAATGYQGGDEFAVLEGRLGRRFPIAASGGPHTRQIQYRLVAGENGWRLVADKVLEF